MQTHSAAYSNLVEVAHAHSLLQTRGDAPARHRPNCLAALVDDGVTGPAWALGCEQPYQGLGRLVRQLCQNLLRSEEAALNATALA